MPRSALGVHSLSCSLRTEMTTPGPLATLCDDLTERTPEILRAAAALCGEAPSLTPAGADG